MTVFSLLYLFAFPGDCPSLLPRRLTSIRRGLECWMQVPRRSVDNCYTTSHEDNVLDTRHMMWNEIVFSKKQSWLLNLPAEIRDLIYEYAVTSEQTIVTFRLDSYQRDSYAQAVQPALTRVSRQIRAESLPVYFGSNDFVLHTESPKADDAQRWFRCNSAHMSKLRRLSLWVRYVPLPQNRNSSQGAIRVSVRRPRKTDSWQVDDEWRWITVVRQPTELEEDAKFIRGRLQRAIAQTSEANGPADWLALLTEVRMLYTRHKLS